mmetsp:Transcript_49707/g.158758  ORF Transcript_49707/g.158758 Transcript_49707/m.158758 type:complete len:345 (+) Transcript_49707:372-1406(+)
MESPRPLRNPCPAAIGLGAIPDPNFVRVTPSSRSSRPTTSLPFLAAMSAPSFTTFWSSAPEKPDATAATCAASVAAPGASRGTPRMCTCRISARPAASGRSTPTRRVRRPGRVSAGSRTSGRLVAASTKIPLVASKPSISVRSWLRVWSRSSFRPAPRRPPTASSSSMNTTHGARLRASAKSSRTRAAPRPTNISTNSEALAEKKGTPASPATALARRVFPVPGGPESSTPVGILAPSLAYRPASRRHCTHSISSTLALSTPATSLNVITFLLPGGSPLGPAFLPVLSPPVSFLIMKKNGRRGSQSIITVASPLKAHCDTGGLTTPKSTPADESVATRLSFAIR